MEDLEKEIARLQAENTLLADELIKVKKLKTSARQKWVYFFMAVGALMFIVSIWESVYTMIDLDREVVTMSNFKLYFAAIGFVFVAANESLGRFANAVGAKLLKAFS